MVARRLLRYLIPHRRMLILAFGLLAAGTAADLAGPILIKHFIDEYLAVRSFPQNELILLASLYLGLQLFSVTMHYFQFVSFHKIALSVIRRLRLDVFGKVQRFSLSFFDRTPAGSLVSRITNDTEAVKDLYVSVLSSFVQNLVFLIGIFVAMFILNVKLALFCIVLLPLLYGLMRTYRKLSSRVYHVSRQKLSQMNAMLSESLQGMSIIQAMRQEHRLASQFARVNREHYDSGMKNIYYNSLLLRPAVDLIYFLTLVMMLSFFGFPSLEVKGLAVEIGVLYAFLNYLDRFFEPVNQILMRLSQLQQALVAGERVFELMDREEDRGLEEAAAAGTGMGIGQGKVEFHNVTFSYDGENDVLRNISFTAEPGQTVALVGHTGSGKSSAINLLMRFYQPREGEILIDDTPLARVPEAELRSQVGLVLQDPFLFVGTVKDNLRLHHQDVTDEQLEEAARFVQADEFIRRLPQGYDEPLGERGATLSSGQRQLLSFARTMVLAPRILVLDEATASVDTETEEAIQTALGRMRQGRTTIAIAHRLSTIQDADLILVLHHGEIVERGTHQELLAMEGLYHKMYLLQQTGTAD